MTRSEPRRRGVRLSDLDRTKVYRIAFVGRRWEVLGPEDAPGLEAAAGADAGAAGAGGARTTTYVPRHLDPAAPSEQTVTRDRRSSYPSGA